MIVSAEIERGDRLSEASVKNLTGNDRQRARRMREDEWSFEPSWTAFMHTNHRPVISGTDDGIWRRVRLIPWKAKIPLDEQDEHLSQKLAEEASGILNWLLEGAQCWLAGDRAEPATVATATDAYREDSDSAGQFLAEAGLVFGPALTIPSQQLRAVHESWFATAGIEGEAKAHFQRVTARLKTRGCVTKRLPTSHDPRRPTWWYGVGDTTGGSP